MARGVNRPGGRTLAGLTGLVLAGAATGALADAPDAFWNAPWVQVTGGDPSLAGAVNLGLKRANETYFYGDRATKMVAIASRRQPGPEDTGPEDGRGAGPAERPGAGRQRIGSYRVSHVGGAGLDGRAELRRRLFMPGAARPSRPVSLLPRHRRSPNREPSLNGAAEPEPRAERRSREQPRVSPPAVAGGDADRPHGSRP